MCNERPPLSADARAFSLANLLREEGLTADEFITRYATESIVPSICTECGALFSYEPDAQAGWCDECDNHSVVSGLILLDFF